HGAPVHPERDRAGADAQHHAVPPGQRTRVPGHDVAGDQHEFRGVRPAAAELAAELAGLGGAGQRAGYRDGEAPRADRAVADGVTDEPDDGLRAARVPEPRALAAPADRAVVHPHPGGAAPDVHRDGARRAHCSTPRGRADGMMSTSIRYRSPLATDSTRSTTSPRSSRDVRTKRSAGRPAGTPSSVASRGASTTGATDCLPDAMCRPNRLASTS